MTRRLVAALAGVLVLAPGVAAGAVVASAWGPARLGHTPAVTATAVVTPAPGTPLVSLRRVGEALAVEASLAGAAAAVRAAADGLGDSSCLVVLRDGAPFVDVRGEVPLVPASNQKVLTAFAVLGALDPSVRFRTTVRAAARPDAAGGVAGDLVMVGGGDPLLVTSRYAQRMGRFAPEPRTSVEALADAVVAAGVREVRGAVVGDDSRYDEIRAVASWPARYLANREVGPLGALAVDDGFVLDAAGNASRSDDPALAAAATFTGLLRERGVVVRAAPRSARSAAASAPVELAAVESAPLTEVVAETLRLSDNNTAELLLKELGLATAGEPSTAAGARAVVEAVRAAGVPGAGLAVVDGSGLDPGNRVTCGTLAAVLQAAGPDSALADGLAVAGVSGTLQRRFEGSAAAGKLRAKTGSIRDVVTLAGFVDGPLGRFTFAFLVNGRGAETVAFARWEVLADALVRPPPGPDPSLLGP